MLKKSIFQNVTSLMLVLIALLQTSFTTSKDFQQVSAKTKWVKLKQLDYHFKAVFPFTPEKEINKSEYATTIKYNAQKDDLVYFIGVTKHISTISDHEEMADVSLESFATAVNGTISVKSDWILGKNKGKKATIDMIDQDVTVLYQVILVGQFQYQLVLTYGSDKEPQPKDVNRFFNGFKLFK